MKRLNWSPATLKTKRFLFFISMLTLSSSLFAQETNCSDGIDNDGDGLIDCFDSDCACYTCNNGQDNIWHLTNGNRIDFNGGTPQTTNTGVSLATGLFPNSLEGNATVSDPNGNLVFFTNGYYVWDRTNTRMNDANTGNTAELDGGASATNAAVVVPHPSNPLQYYIFTAGDAYGHFGGALIDGIDYSIVDFSPTSNNGLGEIISTDVPLIPKEMSTEKFVVVRKPNCRDYWVITHDYEDFSGTNTNPSPGNTYMTYEVVASSGLNTTPILSTQSSGIFHHQTNGGGNSTSADRQHKQGQLALSPDQTLVVNAVSGTSSVEVGYFNNATGQVSILFPLTVPNNEHAWGVSFSPSGQHLYVTTNSQGLYRYNVATGAVLAINNPSGNTHGYLHIGPDNNLYMSEYGGDVVQIIDPDGIPSLLSTGFSAGGHALPYTIPDYCQPTVDVVVNPTSVCAGDPITATATVTNGAAASSVDYDYVWNTGNMNQAYTFTPPNESSSTISEIVPFGSSPIYSVLVTDHYGCTATDIAWPTVNATPMVNITANPASICLGQSTVLTATGGLKGSTYAWEVVGGATLPQTTSFITVSPITTTTYSVTITNGNGCFASNQITVQVANDFPIHHEGLGTDDSPDLYTDSRGNMYSTFHFQDNIMIHGNLYKPSPCERGSALVKYDACDNVEWVYHFEGCIFPGIAGNANNLDGMGVDSHGDIYILGEVPSSSLPNSFGSTTITASGYYVLQFNSAGTPISAQLIPPPLSSAYTTAGLIVDNNDDIITINHFNGVGVNVKVHKFEGVSFPSPPIWVVAPAGLIEGVDVITDSNNDIIVSGMTLVNNLDIYVSKLKANSGATIWTQTFASVAIDAVSDIAVNSQNDVVITGYSNGPIAFGTINLSAMSLGDGYLATLKGTNGTPIWASHLVGVGNPFPSLAVGPQDNIFLATNSTLLHFTTTKYDVSGNQLWSIPTNNSTVSVYQKDIAIKPNGLIYVSGLLQGSIVMNGNTYTSGIGVEDVIITRILDQQTNAVFARPSTNSSVTNTTLNPTQVTTTSITDIQSAALQANIYPNPTMGLFTLDLKATNTDLQVENIRLLDIRGQQLEHINIDNASQNQYTIDMAKYSAGVYLVQVITKNQTLTKQITLIK